MDAPKLYYDVTQLIHWPGKLTGIPRVMHELAIRFQRDKSDTIFVAWVKEIQEFCEVDLAATLAQRGSGIVYLKAGQPEVGQASDISQQKTQLESLKAGAVKGAVKVAKLGFKVGRRLNPDITQKLETRLKLARIEQYKIATPRERDQLFIPWGEWWDPQFTERLVELRTTKGLKLIQVIHDIGTTVCPQFYEQIAVNPTSYNARVVPIADLVLAVSHNTKKELTAWLKQNHLDVPPIKVFRNGDSLSVSEPMVPHEPGFAEAHLQGGDFLLCVGTIEAKKNHLLFYYTYKLAKARGVELPALVIAGRRGYGTDMTYAMMTRDVEVADKFVFLHDASDEELTWLYDHCLFTVLPSFHEGWGIPIAESLARGVPALCSNTSSMTEIAEDIVGHFSPASPDELLAGIRHWLDPRILAVAREKTKQYRPFSWDESFKQITQHMEETL